MNRFFLAFFVVFLATSCSGKSPQQNSDGPSWYISPKQNNSENLYGVAEGYTLEEATKYALADAASRLIVSISSESSLLREENQTSTNEEMRQQVRQSVEKISFTNFHVTNSINIGPKIFVEVQIDRTTFLNEQKDKVSFLERQVADLDKNSLGRNTIQRRNSLLKILGLEKELELKARILAGAGENINLKEKLNRTADFQNELEKLSDKTEFYFEINSPREISQIIRSSLNKEKIKISPSRNNFNANQVVIKIKSSSRSLKIYESYLTKLEIDFENLAEGKVVASNSVEVTGSSSISDKESYASALKSLEEKISQDGILKIIGITN